MSLQYIDYYMKIIVSFSLNVHCAIELTINEIFKLKIRVNGKNKIKSNKLKIRMIKKERKKGKSYMLER